MYGLSAEPAGHVVGRFGAALVLAATLATSAVAADYLPARLFAGGIPQPPVNSIGWIEAVVDLDVTERGIIAKATGIRATPGGLEFIEPYIRNWAFRAATDGPSPVGSHVLVAALIRPPQLVDPAPGQGPVDLAPPSDTVPYPISVTRPLYPANALGDRSVLVEVLVGIDGKVERATVVGAASGFDSEALIAANGWRFRPARYKGQPVPGVAYLILGFRAPIVF